MTVRILEGDCMEVLRSLSDESVHCVVTSPPYFGLRDYGMAGQIGLEPTPGEFVAKLVAVFREVRRVLRADGTAWVNMGDSYGRAPEKGGSGPNGKHEYVQQYGNARALIAESAKRGSSDGAVGRAARPGTRASSVKPKDLIGVPWMLAFALREDGWYLRQDIIWSKPNPMPESVRDRCTKAHEYIFLLSKSERYYFDNEAIAEPATSAEEAIFAGTTSGLHSGESHAGSGESTRRFGKSGNKVRTAGSERGIPGAPTGATSGVVASGVPWQGVKRNKRSVWIVPTQPFAEAHFATLPPALIEPCILAGCPEGGTVLDPFGGAGTTGLVADRLQRNAILIELNPEYAAMARRRISGDSPLFAEVA